MKKVVHFFYGMYFDAKYFDFNLKTAISPTNASMLSVIGNKQTKKPIVTCSMVNT